MAKKKAVRPRGRPVRGAGTERCSVTLPVKELEFARKHGINISAACAEGLRDAIAREIAKDGG